MKNREFWEALEQIRALYANKDGHSYTCIAFRELHSKKHPDDSVQKII